MGVAITPADFDAYTIKYSGISPTEYAQSATAPTNAGSYAVEATLTDANYQLVKGDGNAVSGQKALAITPNDQKRSGSTASRSPRPASRRPTPA